MSLSAQEYAQKSQELCVLPEVYYKLTELLNKKNCNMQQIAEVVSYEPAIAASLLKIANSAMFNMPKKVDSLSKALVILGVTEVKKLVDAYGVTAALATINPETASIDKFWEISIDCALICQYLGDKKSIPNTNNIFLSGLFHNLGLLALVHNEPEKVKYCEQYNSRETPWQRQKEAFGFTFADCSAALLTLWHLPKSIIKPIIEFNHAYQKDSTANIYLLYLASRLAILNAHPGLYNKRTFIGSHILDELEISDEEIDECLNFCNEKAVELLAAFPINKS